MIINTDRFKSFTNGFIPSLPSFFVTFSFPLYHRMIRTWTWSKLFNFLFLYSSICESSIRTKPMFFFVRRLTNWIKSGESTVHWAVSTRGRLYGISFQISWCFSFVLAYPVFIYCFIFPNFYYLIMRTIITHPRNPIRYIFCIFIEVFFLSDKSFLIF